MRDRSIMEVLKVLRKPQGSWKGVEERAQVSFEWCEDHCPLFTIALCCITEILATSWGEICGKLCVEPFKVLCEQY